MIDLDFALFLTLMFGLPWVLYRASSSLWERRLPGVRRGLLPTFVQLFLCVLLPYVVLAAGETWWGTRYGDHTGNAEFIRLDWGNFQIGVTLWFYVSLFAACCLTLVVSVRRQASRTSAA